MAYKSETFVFETVPKSVEELSSLKEAALETPFQAAALTVLALCRYCEDEKKGIEMLNFLKGPEDLSVNDMNFIRERLKDKKYLPNSYFEGATVENNYTPTEPLTITISENPYSYAEEGYAKLFIQSSGADQARPIQLRQKGKEQWFLWEQFLLASIRIPKEEDPWA